MTGTWALALGSVLAAIVILAALVLYLVRDRIGASADRTRLLDARFAHGEEAAQRARADLEAELRELRGLLTNLHGLQLEAMKTFVTRAEVDRCMDDHHRWEQWASSRLEAIDPLKRVVRRMMNGAYEEEEDGT